MRCALVSVLVTLCACAFVLGKGAAPAREHPGYRLGKAPKSEFKVAGKSYKIDPEAKSTKAVRDLPPEHFDPITRPGRVERFYRDTLKERYEEARRLRHHCGPFRSEFIEWTRHWPAAVRARWAWHHRMYIEEALWADWMADHAFAAEIAALERQHEAVVVGYMPPEYASTSPVFVYNDEYMDAVYNPVPFLAVLTLKSLKPDAQTDWIGPAAVDSLLSRLSSVPGLFVADHDQVAGVLRDQKLPEPDAADPSRAAQVGKAMDVERVVAGSYVVDGDKVLFNLRIVNVQTGAVENGISKTFPRDRLLDEMPGLATSLATALGYEPEVESVAVVAPAADATPASLTPAAPLTPAQPTPAPAKPTPAQRTPAWSPPAQPTSDRPALPPPGTTIPAGGSIFDFGDNGSQPASPSGQGSGKNAKHVFAASDKINGNLSLTAADGPYEIQDKLTAADGVKDYTLRIEPGADIRGGTIDWGKSGHVEIAGTAEAPAVFHNVTFVQKLGGAFSARYAVFDNCKFRKGGAYYSRSGFSSKWEFDKCFICGASSLPKITHVDYGIKFTECTFSNVSFEDIYQPTPKDKPLDYMQVLRKDWRIIDHCRFDNCSVPPTIFWCAVSSNYTRCKFVAGRAFESDTATDVVAYVADTTGDAPDKVSAANPPTRAALKFVYAPQPFPVFAFPASK